MTTKTKPQLLDLIDALAPVVRRAMLGKFTSNCCIATCRVLRRAFQHFGYEPEVLPVSVYIYNSAMARLLLAGIPFPEDARDKQRFFAISGAWGVGILPSSSGVSRYPAFGGHLVLRVGRTLIDASIEQAQRPAKSIMLPQLLSVDPEPAFFRGPAAGQKAECTLSNGVVVVYERLYDYSFRSSPDWKRVGTPYVEILHKIIVETKQMLEVNKRCNPATLEAQPTSR